MALYNLLPMFVAIFSGRQNFDLRNASRQVWTRAVTDNADVVFKFIICDADDDLQHAIANEACSFEDMLILPCEEGYLQGKLTNKLVLSLKVFRRTSKSFFMKVDDDTFVRVREFMASVSAFAGPWAFMGMPNSDHVVIRDESHRWFEPFDTYPSVDNVYPFSMQGGNGYVIARNLVDDIFNLHIASSHMLFNEDRAVAVWIDTLKKHGRQINVIALPGSDLWNASSTTRHSWTRWGDFHFLTLHHASSRAISCLAHADLVEHARIDDCFRSDNSSGDPAQALVDHQQHRRHVPPRDTVGLPGHVWLGVSIEIEMYARDGSGDLEAMLSPVEDAVAAGCGELSYDLSHRLCTVNVKVNDTCHSDTRHAPSTWEWEKEASETQMEMVTPGSLSEAEVELVIRQTASLPTHFHKVCEYRIEEHAATHIHVDARCLLLNPRRLVGLLLIWERFDSSITTFTFEGTSDSRAFSEPIASKHPVLLEHLQRIWQLGLDAEAESLSEVFNRLVSFMHRDVSDPHDGYRRFAVNVCHLLHIDCSFDFPEKNRVPKFGSLEFRAFDSTFHDQLRYVVALAQRLVQFSCESPIEYLHPLVMLPGMALARSATPLLEALRIDPAMFEAMFTDASFAAPAGFYKESLDDTLGCTLLLLSEYDSSHVLPHNVGHWQEPLDRMFAVEDWLQFRQPLEMWQKSRRYADHANTSKFDVWRYDQMVRLHSLWAVLPVMVEFFTNHFPTLQWWVSGGSLIGTLRSGSIIPWDTDLDIGVNMRQFNTHETMNTLLGMSSLPVWLTKLDSGRERETLIGSGPPLYIPLTENVALVINPLPINVSAEFPFVGRFMDLKTGYFAEIFDDRIPVETTRRCMLQGIMVNVPGVPVSYLNETQDYGETIRSVPGQEAVALNLSYMTRSRLYQCHCRSSSFAISWHNGSTVVDPFKVAFAKPCGTAESQAWEPRPVDRINWKCCNRIGDATPSEIWTKPTCQAVRN